MRNVTIIINAAWARHALIIYASFIQLLYVGLFKKIIIFLTNSRRLPFIIKKLRQVLANHTLNARKSEN